MSILRRPAVVAVTTIVALAVLGASPAMADSLIFIKDHNMGGRPSWVDGDTIVLGSGSASQSYYTLGMPHAAEWFRG